MGRADHGRCAIPGLSGGAVGGAGDSAGGVGASTRPYESAADAWLAGADPAYRRFADALVAAAPDPLSGLRVLDIGAGTGAATRSLLAVGAQVWAVDESPAMLRTARGVVPGVALVAGDATALPFADGSFDAAVSAFCINHLDQPHLLLAEAGRVVRRGGCVLASTFEEGDDHPAKAAIDSVLARWGWQQSAWHRDFHSRTSGLTATPGRLVAIGERAGLDDVRVVAVAVDTGLTTASELVGWRLGMAEQATFLATMPPADRAALTTEAEAAIGAAPPPLIRTVLVLVARAS